MVRHTKAAVGFAHELLALEQNSTYTDDEKDLMIVALMLHDGMKHGIDGGRFTVATHPTEMADFIRNDSELCAKLKPNEIDILLGAISSHMGEWNTDYKSKKEILPKPETDIQKFVHMCDYLASRKYLNYDFGEKYYNPSDYKVDELKPKIDELINICKEKIAEGMDKEKLYGIIADFNDGRKNPNSIKTKEVAEKIINKIKDDVVE